MVNVALIGSGYWGSKIASALDKIPAVNKIQIIDIRGGHTIDDIDSDITAALIATPLWDHFGTAQKLLERGLDCYIEKPMTETESETRELAMLKKDHVVMVGHIFMFHPAVDYIKSILPKIGTVKHVVSERLNWGIYQTKTTPLLSLLPHDVSILIELFGADIEVKHAESSMFNNKTVPDYVRFSAKVGDISIDVRGSWYWPERVRKLTIIGDQGHIIWDDVTNTVKLMNGTVVNNRLEDLTETTYTPDLTVTPLERELQHFVDSVVARTEPKTGTKQAIEVAKILDTVLLKL